MLSRFLNCVFGDATTPPPAGMHIVPCSALDVEQRHTVLTIGLIIDSSLSAQKLEHSLSTLIECKFPRAGARLAFRNKVYEFHIPCTFESHTPAITFTADHHHEPYRSGKHPDLHSFMQCTDSEPIFCRYPALRTYLTSKKCPTSTAKFVGSKIPMLNVHVSIFDDITLVGVTAPRILFDVPGIGTLLHAWTQVLNGDSIDRIAGMEWDTAPFETFCGPTPSLCVRGHGYLPPQPILGSIYEPSLLRVISRIRDCIRDRDVSLLIRVPKAFLAARKQEIMGDLKFQGSSELVTYHDVLLAWWVKTSYSFRKSDDQSRMIAIHIPVDLRSQPIFSNMFTSTKLYINNASSTIFIPSVTVKSVQEESLGDLALRIRRATTLYNAEPFTIEHELRWRNLNLHIWKFNIHRCPPGHKSEMQTNGCDAHLSELDFSGACTATAEKQTARVLFVFADNIMSNDYMSDNDIIQYTCTSLRGTGTILMEDENAIWMSQVKGRREWEKICWTGLYKFIK